MLFNSVIFITLFLPLTLLGWYLLQKLDNALYAKLFLLGMSLWFYGYYNPRYLLILLGSLALNYLCSFLFDKCQGTLQQKLILALGLTGNIGILFYFKYFNFFIDNCNFLFHSDWQIERIALPLGISFFTFQQLSFVIDRYRKDAPHYSFVDYGCFVTFFPQLIAGPIVLHSEFVPQLQARQNRRIDGERFYDGTALFILGLGKKVLLADVLALIVNAEFGNIAYLDAPGAWLTVICYMFQLYFDFSGYCDMARGIGRMFGFELPINFDSPHMSVSVSDFWRRWHMTLSRFLTTYIYFPLGGNRKGMARQCLNLMIVFLVSGFWHGANWTFVVWSLLHGVAMVTEKLFPKLHFRNVWVRRLTTNIFMLVTLAVFRSDSLGQAGLLLQKMFAGGNHNMLIGACNMLQIPETYAIRKGLSMLYPQALNLFYVICVVVLLAIAVILTIGPKAEQWIEKWGRTKRGLFCLATILVWSFISLSQVSVFLYFNF